MRSSLASEIKQTRPFRSVYEEATLSITRTAAILEHRLAQALKPFDITPTQYNVLRILRGSSGDGLCRNEVGERLIRPVPDVTRLLDRMEELGLITRRRGSADRRFVSTTLSTRGSEVVDRLDKEICAIHREHLGHLDESRLHQLIELLADVRSKG